MLDDSAGLEAQRGGVRLPEYSVRRSSRARRARLSVTAHHGLVVTVPSHFRGDVGAIVASKRAWAERALAHVADQRALLLAGPEALLPHVVSLPALALTLPVEYVASAAAIVSARTLGGTLVVRGDVDDAEKCLAALRRWLTRTAVSELVPWCDRVSRRIGLLPDEVTVNRARTRWGSCSSRRKVRLNRNLLFLPPELVEALMLHELAHLEVLDHSARFWSLLATLDPEVLEHRARMKRAHEFVPAWADG